MDKSKLGDRMKRYEAVSKTLLMRRTPVIIRVDGKAFHTLTRKMDKPFDPRFNEAMNEAAFKILTTFQGSQAAYIQSDEISVLLLDYQSHATQAPFDYSQQKLVSVSAAAATYGFMVGAMREGLHIPSMGALFDSRAFNIQETSEVLNYLVWRQQDAIRNSIQGMGQANFSQRELHRVNCGGIKTKLLEKGLDWDALSPDLQRGRWIYKEYYWPHDPDAVKKFEAGNWEPKARSRWRVCPAPLFSNERQLVVDQTDLKEEQLDSPLSMGDNPQATKTGR